MNADLLARYDGQLPAHFRLAPSSSSRWLNCPDSAQCGLPESTNAAADKGRLLHLQAAALVLEGKPLADVGVWPPVLREYVNFVLSLAGELLVETQFVSQSIFDLGGTIDALRITKAALHIVDLKTGAWPVSALDNTQMKTYLVLAREQFPKPKKFFATIVQDQKGRLIHSTEFTADELDEHRAAIIRVSVSRQRSGGEWCRFCPLRTSCPQYVSPN